MKKLAFASALAMGATGATFAAADCGEVSISEMDWASSAVVTYVAKFLMEQGYGCTVQTIPTTTVRSALAQVRARRDTIGIVYRSDALAFPEDVHVVCLVPMAEGPDIVYPAAILADAPNPEGAQQFLDYLQSSRAAVTWHEAGFFFAP